MSAEVLREAAREIRADYIDDFGALFCECKDKSFNWFDRSVCPEPCGSMHTVCIDCGRIQGHCAVAVEVRTIQTRTARAWLAVADWLDDEAERADDNLDRYRPDRTRYDSADAWVERNHRAALHVARAYLGDP